MYKGSPGYRIRKEGREAREERVRGNSILNRIKYALGLGESRDYSDTYSSKRHYAELFETDAKEAPLPLRASLYEKAARNWLRAKETNRAAAAYLKASISWEKLANLSAGQSDARSYMKHSEKSRVQANRLGKVRAGKWHGLEGRVTATAAILAMIGGLFFLSFNITGNAIGNLTMSNNSMIGAGLIIVGFILCFLWLRKKKKKKRAK